jgi:hypothetical protein
MRNFFCLLFVVLISNGLVVPTSARAEIPPKAKAFLTIVGYGTAGGAILGTATMAFGTSSRAISQGASLGLYAGIMFGTYVRVSHHNRRQGSYDDKSSPYQRSSDIYSDEYSGDAGGGEGSGESSGGSFFDRFQVLQEKFHGQAFTLGAKRKGGLMPPVHMNLFQFNF